MSTRMDENTMSAVLFAQTRGQRIPHGHATGGGVMSTYDISGKAESIMIMAADGKLKGIPASELPLSMDVALWYVNRGWTPATIRRCRGFLSTPPARRERW